jgi:hypothetical protein
VWVEEMRLILWVGHLNTLMGISKSSTSVSQIHHTLLLEKHLTKHLIYAKSSAQCL